MRFMIPTLTLVFASGCATTGTGGFWRELDARKSDASFHLVRYVGTQSDCFPPISNRECMPLRDGEVIYEETQKLEMEEFSLSLPSRDFFAQAGVRDMLFLAASDLALQRGFSMFTVTWEMEIATCQTYGAEATSSGSVDGSGYYSGTTRVTPNTICGGSQTIRVLMFNDKAPLAAGVFGRSNSGPARWLYPERSLYYGTLPGLRFSDFNAMPEPGVRTSTPVNAWKIHYDARGLAADLRQKYKLGETVPISFRDELSENLAREAADPLQRNRVVSP